MGDDGTPIQYWVRTGDGRVMGPLTFVTIELLAPQGVFGTTCEVSLDGMLFAPPGDMPDVRDAFPRDLWGVEVEEEPARPPPGYVPPSPVGTRPAGRVHQAPIGERAPAAADARTHSAPAGTAARKDREAVSEGVPLPELIPTGPLYGGTVLRLYYLVAASKKTGSLVVEESDDRNFEIFFKKGQPEHVATSDARLSLSSHLVRTGKLGAEKALEAEAARGRFGGQVINALFAMGLIEPQEAFALIGDHARGLLRQAMQVDTGTFTWNPAAAVPDGTLPLGSALALLGAAGRTLDATLAFGRLGNRIDCPVMRAGDGLARAEELGLTAVEARVLAAFDGTRSLAEIAAASPADAELVYRLGWFLGEVGFASFARAVRPRPVEAPMFGEVPPLPGAGPVFDAELEAAAAPMAPPGVVMAAGMESPYRGEEPPRSEPPPQPTPALPRVAAPAPSPPRLEPTPGPLRFAPTPGPSVARLTGTPGPFARPGTPGPAASRITGTPGPPPRLTATPGPVASRIAATPGPIAPRPLAPEDRTPGIKGAARPAPSAPADVASLQKLVNRMAQQDHFQLLGIPKNATTVQVKQAFFKMAREHHPDTAGPEAGPEVRRLKEDIAARLNEANQDLGDDSRRADYLARLAAGVKSNEVDLSAILAAEETFNMAAILVKARKYAEALPELEKAIGLNPKEGEFYAWRGFARFCAAQDKRSVQEEAVADIKKALALNERCAVAYLFAGRIANVLGNNNEAARQYRSCLDLDPRNIEAQRELRLLDSRAGR